MVLDPIPKSLPVHFFGSRPHPPTSRDSEWISDRHNSKISRFRKLPDSQIHRHNSMSFDVCELCRWRNHQISNKSANSQIVESADMIRWIRRYERILRYDSVVHSESQSAICIQQSCRIRKGHARMRRRDLLQITISNHVCSIKSHLLIWYSRCDLIEHTWFDIVDVVWYA